MRAAQFEERLREFGYAKAISGAAWPALSAVMRPGALSALTVLLIHRFRAHECPHLARVGRDVLVLVAKLVWEHDRALLHQQIRHEAERRCVLPAVAEKVRAASLPAITLLMIRDLRQDECPEVARVPRDTIVAIAKKVWKHDMARTQRELEPQLEEAIAEVRAMNAALYLCFELATGWLKDREQQDNTMLAEYDSVCDARGWPKVILFVYYTLYEYEGLQSTKWSTLRECIKRLLENTYFFVESVEWGAQNMVHLDRIEKTVRDSRKS
jgi:hypothetical protein